MTSKTWLIIGSLLLIFTYLLVLQLIAIWPFTIDDMYISLRYAKNWAEGYGLVWNIGEEPVEGYSNFSFVVLAVLAIHLGLDPVMILKMSGIFGLLLSTVAIYYLTRFWFSRWFAFIPCMWLLVYRGEILWSVSGLETAVYQALVCFSLLFLLRGMGYRFYPQQRGCSSWIFFALAGLSLVFAGLTRPEAPALMLLFFILALFDKPQSELKKYYQGLLLGSLLCLSIFIPYFLWRWAYYGRLFPNPVYCKTIINFFGLMDKQYLLLALPFLILGLLAIGQLGSRGHEGIFWQGKDRRHYFFWLPSLLYLGLLCEAYPVSAFENRLFLPAFALLLPLAFLGLSHLCAYVFPRKDEVFQFTLLISSFWVAFFFLHPLTLANYRFFSIAPQNGIKLRNQVLNWLKHNVSPNSQVVLADSGQIPYLSSLRYIDSYCLNNKAMTAPPKTAMYQRLCEEIFTSKPDVLILTSLVGKEETTYTPTDLCLHKRLKHNTIYQFRTSFKTSSQPYFYRYEIYTLLSEPRFIIRAAHFALLSEPRTLLSEPRTLLSEPRTLLSEPRTLLSEPRTLLSEPRTLLSEPRTLLSEPRT